MRRQLRTITDPRQIRALASTARQEIVDAATTTGPFTIADLAQRLGRRADGLYFHVRTLERVGLVRQVGVRGSGRARAVVYDLAARPLRIEYGPLAGRATRLGPVIDGILRLARRDVRRALADRAAVVDGPNRDTWGARGRGWLDVDQLARVNALLSELLSIVNSGQVREGAVPVALVFAMTRVVAPRARRTHKGGSS